MRMSKVLFSSILCVILFGCTSITQRDVPVIQVDQKPDYDVLSLWTFLDPGRDGPRDRALKLIIENFEKDHPDTRIKVETHEWSTLAAKFLVASSNGNAPDIGFINTSGLGGLIKTGAGTDLNELFIHRWSEEERNDFFIQPSWDAALVDGKRFAVPIIIGTQSLFYRKDLFARVGIDPDSLKTWDQFIAAAQELTIKDETGSVEIWGFGFPLMIEKGDTNTFIYSLIELQDDIFPNGKPNYANAAGVQSLMLQANFISTYGTTPKASIMYSSDDIVEQFIEGKYAIILGPFARYPNIYTRAQWGGENLGILRMPNWNDDRYGPVILKGWWAAVSEQSKHKEKAGKFVEYMINEQSQRIWGTVGGQIPTRLSVYSDLIYQKPEYSYMSELIENLEDWNWLNPVDLNMTGYEDDISYAIQRYLFGNTDPLIALSEAERKFNARQ